ncbi:MAG: S8 family serine peptidase [Myxococcota bacterium]|nr:S8 family serine peptidase [Myxococcota bacterium]
MKRHLWILGLFGAAFLVMVIFSVTARTGDGLVTSAAPLSGPVDPPTGAVLVDLDDGASDADHADAAARIVRAIAPFRWPAGEAALGDELSDEANLFRIEPPLSEIDDVIRALSDDPDVEVVEVERRWSLPDAAAYVRPTGQAPAPSDDPDRFVPNDPYYPHQWHLDQIGMPRAWTMSRGAGVVVAVIDTGVAHREEGGFHLAPDLGQTRFAEGYDFVDGDAHPDDEHGHGTHVAGTVAQSTHNGVGVAGVAPEATIMPLKVLDRNGTGGWGGIAAAIRYAADHGAHVINMSLGGGMPSRAVQRAIDYAHGKGVLVVAAAGNSSRSRVEYPARANHVVAVGAVRYDRELTFYSCYGTGLDVVAPGGDLRVDQNGDGMPDGVLQNTMVRGDTARFDYLAWQGTSMAAPHVAGVAALLYANGVTDPDSVERILKQSADDLGDAHRYGSGLVQAPAALSKATQEGGLARGAAALGLSLLVLLGLRRKQALGVAPAGTAAFAVVGAGGLGALPWALAGLGGLGGLLSLGALGAAASPLGAWGALLLVSALPTLGAVALGYHVKRLRPLLVGLGIGSAAFMAVEALWPTLRFALLPEAMIGPWLLLNALGALGLAAVVARKAR